MLCTLIFKSFTYILHLTIFLLKEGQVPGNQKPTLTWARVKVSTQQIKKFVGWFFSVMYGCCNQNPQWHTVIVTPMATTTRVPLTTLNTSPKRFTLLYLYTLPYEQYMLYLFCTLMKNWFNLCSSSSSSTNKVNHEISSSSSMNWLYFVKPKEASPYKKYCQAFFL
jgi:hypothetical protein